MQKPHNPSGNALTIVQHSKLLSPQDRLQLQEGSEKLTSWREIFSEDTSPDLHSILDILEPMLKLFEMSRKKGTLPEYGRAVHLVLEGAYRKFQTWRCFEGWGQQSEVLHRNPIIRLPIIQTDAAIRKCDCIGNINPFARLGVLSQVDHQKMYEIHRNTSRWDYLCFINETKDIKQETHVSSLYFRENHVEIMNVVITRGEGQKSMTVISSNEVVKHRVSLQDTILLVSGLLDDVISYSRRVRGEIDASQSFIKNIRNKINL